MKIYSAADLKLSSNKRKPAVLWLQLNDSEPLDTFIAQILVKIDSVLHPPSLSLDHYDIKFAIPRVSPNPMTLSDDASYQFLLSRATKPKDPNATLMIEAARVPEPDVVDVVCPLSFPHFSFLLPIYAYQKQSKKSNGTKKSKKRKQGDGPTDSDEDCVVEGAGEEDGQGANGKKNKKKKRKVSP